MKQNTTQGHEYSRIYDNTGRKETEFGLVSDGSNLWISKDFTLHTRKPDMLRPADQPPEGPARSDEAHQSRSDSSINSMQAEDEPDTTWGDLPPWEGPGAVLSAPADLERPAVGGVVFLDSPLPSFRPSTSVAGSPDSSSYFPTFRTGTSISQVEEPIIFLDTPLPRFEDNGRAGNSPAPPSTIPANVGDIQPNSPALFLHIPLPPFGGYSSGRSSPDRGQHHSAVERSPHAEPHHASGSDTSDIDGREPVSSVIESHRGNQTSPEPDRHPDNGGKFDDDRSGQRSSSIPSPPPAHSVLTFGQSSSFEFTFKATISDNDREADEHATALTSTPLPMYSVPPLALSNSPINQEAIGDARPPSNTVFGNDSEPQKHPQASRSLSERVVFMPSPLPAFGHLSDDEGTRAVTFMSADLPTFVAASAEHVPNGSEYEDRPNVHAAQKGADVGFLSSALPSFDKRTSSRNTPLHPQHARNSDDFPRTSSDRRAVSMSDVDPLPGFGDTPLSGDHRHTSVESGEGNNLSWLR
ncbi:hypothetical protein BDW22DRAFT_1452661 [Trametopsis cervina]|nr:hypothetical protein BDW22DRAFT_1452661 [Trametopsis cervina]